MVPALDEAVGPALGASNAEPVVTAWPPERIELLERLWPSAVATADVVQALQDLPGWPLTAKAVTQKAFKLRLRRPQKQSAAHAPAEPEPEEQPAADADVPQAATAQDLNLPASTGAATPAPVPQQQEDDPLPAPPVPPPVAAVPHPGATVCVDYATAYGWAAQRGLAGVRNPFDLDRTNAKRIYLGLPAFVLQGRSGTRVPAHGR